MTVRQKQSDQNVQMTLGEAATCFLQTSSGKNAALQQEVFKFVRWFGEEGLISALAGQEIVNYCDQFNTSATHSVEHLSAVKLFLGFMFKQGHMTSNYAPLVRIKKQQTRKSVAGVKDETVMLTKQGHEELQEKLQMLKQERPRIAEEIRRAAADKDFRENAPLEAAREQQGHLEAKIREIENTLKRAKVVETDNEKSPRITIGNVAVIEEIDTGEKYKYLLVGSRESDVKNGKISVNSPIGQALFDKELGDTISVNAPSGAIKYKILEINQQ